MYLMNPWLVQPVVRLLVTIACIRTALHLCAIRELGLLGISLETQVCGQLVVHPRTRLRSGSLPKEGVIRYSEQLRICGIVLDSDGSGTCSFGLDGSA